MAKNKSFNNRNDIDIDFPSELSYSELQLLLKNMISPFSYCKMLYDNNGNPFDYVFIFVNDAFEKETNIKRKDLIGKTVLEIFPKTEKYWIELCGKVAQTCKAEYCMNYASALNNWYETRIYSPNTDYFAITVNNVTDIILKQNALEKSILLHEESENNLFIERELLKTTLMSIGDGVICTDNNAKITLLNKIAEKLTGWTSAEALGQDIDVVLDLIEEYSQKKILSPVRNVINTNKSIELGNHIVLISKDGKKRSIEDCASPILRNNGEFIGTILILRDVTEKKETQKEIEFLGYHDQLTGLYNRRFFETELLRADSKNLLPLSIIMGDLNGLKFTNDTFGHNSGDNLLVVLSNILKNHLRQNDIVCRYGGDEFVVILPCTTMSTATELINRINLIIQNTYIENGLLSVAFGCATKADPSEDIYKIIKEAEDNMYRKKMLDTPSFRSTIIKTIENTLYENNSRESLHSIRVSELCYKIGNELRLDDNSLNLLKMAGRLHDLGKVILLNGIIDKPDKLTSLEWQDVKRHPEVGYRILSSSNEFSDIAVAVLEHHERWDGQGYPKGISGKSISLTARIINVADSFDAMTIERPYRKALTIENALIELKEESGRQFDPEIVEAFFNINISEL